MKLQQLSVFLENRPGRLSGPCQVLADAGVNIVTLSLADTEQFGIMRLIVHDWQSAKELLAAKGWVVKQTEVVAVELAERPGGLAEVLQAVEGVGLNIEYMYALTYRRNDQAIMVFRFENPDGAVRELDRAGFGVLGEAELFTD